MLVMTAITPVMAVDTWSEVNGSWLMPARLRPVWTTENSCTIKSTMALTRSCVSFAMFEVALWSALAVFAMIDLLLLGFGLMVTTVSRGRGGIVRRRRRPSSPR